MSTGFVKLETKELFKFENPVICDCDNVSPSRFVEEYVKLEKRYLDLLKDIEEYQDDDNDDSNNNNDDNNFCKVSTKPKKICLPSC